MTLTAWLLVRVPCSKKVGNYCPILCRRCHTMSCDAILCHAMSCNRDGSSRIKLLTRTWRIRLEVDSDAESLSLDWNLELEQSHILREEETLRKKSGSRIVLAKCHSSFVAEYLIATTADIRRLVSVEGKQRSLALPSVNHLTDCVNTRNIHVSHVSRNTQTKGKLRKRKYREIFTRTLCI